MNTDPNIKNPNPKEVVSNGGSSQSEPTRDVIAQGNTIGDRPSLDKDIYRAEARLAQLNSQRNLREAARPLKEYLEQYHPHMKAIVDANGVEIMEGLQQLRF